MMPKNTKPASERIFYRAPRKWELWKLQWLWTAPSLVFCVLAFLIADKLLKLSQPEAKHNQAYYGLKHGQS